MCHPPRRVQYGSIRRLPHPSGLGPRQPASLGMLLSGRCSGLGMRRGTLLRAGWGGTPLARGTPPGDAAMGRGMPGPLGFVGWVWEGCAGKGRRGLGSAPNPPPQAKAVGASEFLGCGPGETPTCSKPTRQQKAPVDSLPAPHRPTPHQRHLEFEGPRTTPAWVGDRQTPPTPHPRFRAASTHLPRWDVSPPTPGMGKRGPGKGWGGRDGDFLGGWGGLTDRTS